jgi:predicted nucleic acid-binding protein
VGIILDSSIVISAERRGDTVAQLLRRIADVTSDQEVALSAIGLTELIHGIYRADNVQRRSARELFINELIADIEVYPFTKDTAALAGKIDGEQRPRALSFPLQIF